MVVSRHKESPSSGGVLETVERGKVEEAMLGVEKLTARVSDRSQ